MIDWINLISGIIIGGAASTLVFWYKYGTRLDEISANFKAFTKYGTNIPPSVCQYCHNDVVFDMVAQDIIQGKMRNAYKCPKCRNVTKQYF